MEKYGFRKAFFFVAFWWLRGDFSFSTASSDLSEIFLAAIWI